MKPTIFVSCGMFGLLAALLSWILQPYVFTVRFWGFGLVFSIGVVTALIASFQELRKVCNVFVWP